MKPGQTTFPVGWTQAGPVAMVGASLATQNSWGGGPLYAINGAGRETVMLRKYVMEASLLKALQAVTPIVKDVEMTAGGLHRFHAVISVKKTSPQQEGMQRNAILAARSGRSATA